VNRTEEISCDRYAAARYVISQFFFFELILLTFYKWQDTVNIAIHSAANDVRQGNNEKESELAMSSISSISGSERHET
jgi:uncharacterized membrane protein SpoIIM required for sporulation